MFYLEVPVRPVGYGCFLVNITVCRLVVEGRVKIVPVAYYHTTKLSGGITSTCVLSVGAG